MFSEEDVANKTQKKCIKETLYFLLNVCVTAAFIMTSFYITLNISSPDSCK